MYLVKCFSWELLKDEELQKSRKLSFEKVVAEIEMGRFRIEKNTSVNHPEQNIYLVVLKGYTHVVPFREIENSILLITIFPSRYWQRKTRGVL